MKYRNRLFMGVSTAIAASAVVAGAADWLNAKFAKLTPTTANITAATTKRFMARLLKPDMSNYAASRDAFASPLAAKRSRAISASVARQSAPAPKYACDDYTGSRGLQP